MVSERLKKQIEFIVEIDKVKQIARQNYVTGGERRETDAEHSWHLAVMALLLAEYASGPADMIKTLKMVLIHDLVEIDAGDTYCFDEQAVKTQKKREETAANRIFGLLPADQARDFRAVWEEFEAGLTMEARLAAALDRLQPLLLHYHTAGRSWREHGITSSKVKERNRLTRELSPQICELVEDVIERAVQKGYLAE
ncbi:Hypothetical protein LUCI_2264 [Lucifera butyrica]|uniref:HD domain-containing protein n=1 Tax=Lucifera butyrica TaxID=1351585 RepID=A0A498R7X2_9FIRM|nr:HD domain-containing protein [Lucifera butyrica]VBB07020.1 Hypothetical protein LUCI_2264 [Lucifera butyrica]